MKHMQKLFGFCVVVVLAFGLSLVGNSSLLAQAKVVAESVPSNANPATGATITVDITIDMTGSPAPDDKLGSFTGTLDWNSTVLKYVSHSGLKAGFTGVVNDANAGTGKLSFNGANPSGAAGKSTVLTITFSVIGANGTSTTLDLGFTAMSAALTFKNLIPILEVKDGKVTVGGQPGGVVARVECPKTDPAPQSTFAVPIFVNMTGSPAPDDKLGSFTGTLEWDPAILQYTSNSGLKSGFTGVINTGNTGTGKLSYNGANPSGASGDVNILDVTFKAVGQDSQTSKMDLGFTAMSAALTFKNLLPILTVQDCSVHIGGGVPPCDPLNCPGAAIYPVKADETTVGKTIDVLNGLAVCIDIRLKQNPGPIDAFGFTVQVDPSWLAFSGFAAGTLTAGWANVAANENPPGSGIIICGGFNITPIPANSAGSLIRLCFKVTCQENQTSAIFLSKPTDDIANFSTCCNIIKCVKCVPDGDVNGDLGLSFEDAKCAFQIFLNGGNLPSGCDVPNFDCEVAAADVNCDGSVTPGDALAIFQRALQGLPPKECFAKSALAQRAARTAPYELALNSRSVMQSGEATGKEVVKVALNVNNPEGLQAFGVTLLYPADKLDFLGVQRTALTANWVQLEGRISEAGMITIGGFDDEPLAAGTGELFEVAFASKGQAINATDFRFMQLVDDLGNALVKTADSGPQGGAIPQAFKLYQNFPNPFHAGTLAGETLIRFDLPGTEPVKVELAIYNVTGQLVRRLVSGTQSPGAYEVAWDGKDDQGHQVPSATYLYRLKAGNLVESKQLTIVR